MTEYVSKTDVLNLPQSIERNLCGEIAERSIDVKDIESLEPADVVPLRHARWRHYEGMYACEACGAQLDDESPFCPMCGAKMDGEWSGLARTIVEAIESIPAADVVPVVRCRNCEYWQTDWNPSIPDRHYCAVMDSMMKADDFCSYGEREE